MSLALPVWNCQFTPRAEDPAPQLNELTVGAPFNLNCKGDIPTTWDGSPVTLIFPTEEDAFTLAILKTLKLEAQEAQFEVTGYKAGQHQPDYVRVVQGQGESAHGFEFTKPTWALQSVLPRDAQPQPYGSLGPWTFGLPLWFYILLGAVIVLGLAALGGRIKRHLDRRRMLSMLKSHATVLKPAHEFYRQARVLKRSMDLNKSTDQLGQLSEQLNREFRLFLLREYRIPALDWSDREILRDLKNNRSVVYKKQGHEIRKVLRELARLTKRQDISPGDLDQLYKMSLNQVERLEGFK